MPKDGIVCRNIQKYTKLKFLFDGYWQLKQHNAKIRDVSNILRTLHFCVLSAMKLGFRHYCSLQIKPLREEIFSVC